MVPYDKAKTDKCHTFVEALLNGAKELNNGSNFILRRENEKLYGNSHFQIERDES